MIFKTLREDIRTVFANDPAAKTWLEVILCYPGLHAIWIHRLSHGLLRWKFEFFARLISHIGRFLTGIEIHPGAVIGRGVVIDHGMGVVVGETTEIGDGCLLYQGVVLGGTSLSKGKRHPTLERDVVVGTGAAILGPINVGDGARIGAGSVVLKDVPPGATVVGIPGKVQIGTHKESMTLEHAKLPDPTSDAISSLTCGQRLLEERLAALEKAIGKSIPADKETAREPDA